MIKSRIITGCLCAVLAGMLPQAALAQGKTITAEDIAKAKPSGTVTLDEEEIRLILGGDRGKGVLTYGGKKYNFTVKGLTAGGIGIAKVHATGNVYFLKKVEDFSGKFTEGTVGAAVVKGVGKASFQNGNGVYMSLKEKATGVDLSLGIGVMEVQLVK